MSFDSLPTEIKCYIFSYLPQDDLVFNVANVSNSWRSLSRDPTVVKRLEINNYYDSKLIIQCLNDYHLARTLKLTNIDNFFWISELPLVNNIQRLIFQQCKFDFVDQPKQLARKFPSLRAIKTRRCTYWQCMSINGCQMMTYYTKGFGGNLIESFAKLCEHLEEIDIDQNCEIDDRSFQIVINLRGPLLKKLSINSEALADASFDALRHCHQLTNLRFYSANTITDSRLLYLKKLTSLKKLALENARCISENAFIELFSNISFSHLQSISFCRCCNLSDDVVIAITKSCPSLKAIDVTNSNITDVSVLKIIQNYSDLESLNLSGNKNISGRYLCGVFSELLKLEYLNFSGCEQVIDLNFYTLQMKERNPKMLIFDALGMEII